jgi:hypothetical protein
VGFIDLKSRSFYRCDGALWRVNLRSVGLRLARFFPLMRTRLSHALYARHLISKYLTSRTLQILLNLRG